MVNIILLSYENNTVCWLYLVYGTMSFLCIFVCVSVGSVCKLCQVFNSRSLEPSRTPRLRISWATPRKGRRPRDGCRSRSPDQTPWHCRRRNSTWPSQWCLLSCPVSVDRCGKPKNKKVSVSTPALRLVQPRRPGSRCPHQRSIRIPGPRRRRCQSTGTGGCPRVRPAGTRCPPPPGWGPSWPPGGSRLWDWILWTFCNMRLFSIDRRYFTTNLACCHFQLPLTTGARGAVGTYLYETAPGTVVCGHTTNISTSTPVNT